MSYIFTGDHSTTQLNLCIIYSQPSLTRIPPYLWYLDVQPTSDLVVTFIGNKSACNAV